ncbi:hypothetical protein ACK3TF_001591 [Chlorella vulgaris]
MQTQRCALVRGFAATELQRTLVRAGQSSRSSRCPLFAQPKHSWVGSSAWGWPLLRTLPDSTLARPYWLFAIVAGPHLRPVPSDRGSLINSGARHSGPRFSANHHPTTRCHGAATMRPTAMLLLAITCLACLTGAAAKTPVVTPGRKWITLIGRNGCVDSSGWLGITYCDEPDRATLYSVAGGVRSTFIMKAVKGNPADLLGVPSSFQILNRVGNCPKRSFLSSSTTCTSSSLVPSSGGEWVLERAPAVKGQPTVHGQFYIRSAVSGNCCGATAQRQPFLTCNPYHSALSILQCMHAASQDACLPTYLFLVCMMRVQTRTGCTSRYLGVIKPLRDAPNCGSAKLGLYPKNAQTTGSNSTVLLVWNCTCCDGLVCAPTGSGDVCATAPSSPGIADVSVIPQAGGLFTIQVTLLQPADTGADGLGISAYTVDGTTTDPSKTNLTVTGTGAQLTLDLTSIACDTNYTFAVTATNAAGLSSVPVPLVSDLTTLLSSLTCPLLTLLDNTLSLSTSAVSTLLTPLGIDTSTYSAAKPGDSVAVELYEANLLNQPTGSLLGSSTLTNSLTSAGFTSLSLPTPFQLAANKKYILVLKGTSAQPASLYLSLNGLLPTATNGFNFLGFMRSTDVPLVGRAAAQTPVVTPGRKWITLIGRNGCVDSSGWLGITYCDEPDRATLYSVAGGVRSTFIMKAVKGNPADLLGVPSSFQILNRVGNCPKRSFLSSSTTCTSSSLVPSSGGEWVLERAPAVKGQPTVHGQFYIRSATRTGCTSRYLGVIKPLLDAPNCGSAKLGLYPKNAQTTGSNSTILLVWNCTCCDGLVCAPTGSGDVCATAPSSPSIADVSVIPQAGGLFTIQVTLLQPADTGADGLGISAYTVDGTPTDPSKTNLTVTGTGAQLTLDLRSIACDTNYTFAVTATNAAGLSSVPCTCCDGLVCAPTGSGDVCATAPSSPGIADVSVIPQAGGLFTIQVTLLQPADTGADGLGISAYTVDGTTTDPSKTNLTVTGTGAQLTLDLTSIACDTNYTFAVTATNAAGLSSVPVPLVSDLTALLSSLTCPLLTLLDNTLAAVFTTPSSPSTIDGLSLFQNPGDSVAVELYEANLLNQPTGSLLGSSTLTNSLTSAGFTSLSLPTPFQLAANKKYILVLKGTSAQPASLYLSLNGLLPTATNGFNFLGFMRSTDVPLVGRVWTADLFPFLFQLVGTVGN